MNISYFVASNTYSSESDLDIAYLVAVAKLPDKPMVYQADFFG
jgi:hypothetical protein